MAKEGSTISGFADAFAQAISYALQKSIVDYIFRWMAAKFLSAEAQFRAGVNNREDVVTTPEQLPLDVAAAAGASPTGAITSPRTSSFAAMQNQEDAPPCSTCGSIMVRSGSCYKCANCGTTSGCA
jgi:ribonucleoside-diphosphate reductase alpha chain